ncbi:MAG: NifB/NifX family molybdenum-iron cluster-binding protein [Halothiobacillaceae bacterium]|nr:NifB/NifX family molybdenum-iron cluster-binding protein [Halothiobacillaceae bacterium]
MRLVEASTEPTLSLKVAFASADRKRVDQHFGAARAFAIYRVSADEARLEEVARFAPEAMDGNEDKLLPKIALLEGCTAVYCQAVGASAVQQLLTRDIQPIKVEEGALIDDLLAILREELRGEPGGWLAKALQRQRRGARACGRLDALFDEAWQE